MSRADRLFALVQFLSGPRRRTLAELATRLETSPRTIYRDLAALEERGVAIERVEGAYRLVESGRLQPLPLTPRERLLLSLALDDPALAMQPAFAKDLRQVRRKIAREQGTPSIQLARPDRSGAIPPGIATAIEEAIAISHSISISYTSLNSGRTRWRAVDPWLIAHRSEAWYVIGRCHEHDEARTFRMDRIRAVLPIGASFVRPDSIDAERWFSASWAVESSNETTEVRILFSPEVAPLVENARHHQAEEKQRLADGRLDYRVRVSALAELARWVAGFGGEAVAVAPRELVEQIKKIAKGTLDGHARRGRVAAKAARGKFFEAPAAPLTDSDSEQD